MQHATENLAGESAEAPLLVDGATKYEENADYWIQIIREHRDKFRTELTDAAILGAIGSAVGLHILDAGCGEGYLSRELHSRGAKAVIGVDSSTRLIEAANEFAAPDGSLSFRVNDVTKLDLDSGSFDLVVCNHLLNDLADPTEPIREFARVLRQDARLVILMLHPCFYGDRIARSDASSQVPADRYFSHRKISQRFNVDGLVSPEEVTSWHRPLEFYVMALHDAGFCLTDLREPHPSPSTLKDDSWWHGNFTKPLFLLLVARREVN